MKAYLIITIIFFSLANLSIANDFKNKIESEIQVSNKKFGGPKSDSVLERIRFNMETSIKDKYGNWILISNGEIVRCCLERKNKNQNGI